MSLDVSRALGVLSTVHATDDLTKLSTRMLIKELPPRFPPGDPDHDPTPLYHITVVLEETMQ